MLIMAAEGFPFSALTMIQQQLEKLVEKSRTDLYRRKGGRWGCDRDRSEGAGAAMASGSIMSYEGIRQDGRRWNELRRMQCDLGVVSGADGSCSFTCGRTKIIASCFVVPLSKQKASAARVPTTATAAAASTAPHVELRVSWLPFATQERRERGRTDRQVVDLEGMLKQTACAMLDASSAVVQKQTASGRGSSGAARGNNMEVQIKVAVLQADGGVRSCCVNAVTCAIGMANLVCGCLVVSCGCTAQQLGRTLRETRMLQSRGEEEEGGRRRDRKTRAFRTKC